MHSSPDPRFPFFATFISVFFGAGIMWLSAHGVLFVKEGTSIVEYVMIPPVAAIGALSNEPKIDLSHDNKITVMVGGDVMLDRQVRKIGEQNGYDSLFSRVAPLLSRADIAVVNLEGPITSSRSKTLLANSATSKELIFTFATGTAEVLARAGIDMVSLANNHTDNFGVAGFEETKHRLEAAGVGWFGSPWNKAGLTRTKCVEDVCITFVGYHEFQKGLDKILADVRNSATSSDFLVVMPHWGDEYVSTSSPRLRKQAEQMVAAGADLIVGAHPHVVMNAELIGDVPVFYSLGNFLFDQYFSEKTMSGSLLEFEVQKDASGSRISKIIEHFVSNKNRNGIDILGSQIIYEN